jgi:DNA mismatch endonuclease, patch repair protein
VKRTTPSYKGLSPVSTTASRIASASSAKRDTKPELLLRRALWSTGLRYRVDVDSLPGRPDVVMTTVRLAVFCDGDFWHGRNLERRVAKLATGHNAPYWVSKIKSNVDRDRRIERLLVDSGWDFLRFWESDVRANPKLAARAVLKVVRARRNRMQKKGRPTDTRGGAFKLRVKTWS